MQAKRLMPTFGRAVRGFTLVELLIVLGIAAIILMGAIGLYDANKQATDSQAEIRNMQTLVTKARQLYNGRSDYANISTKLLVDAGGLPSSMSWDGTDLTNSWGGLTSVAGSATAGLFDVSYTKVPVKNCIDMGMGAVSTAQYIKIGTADALQTVAGGAGAQPSAVEVSAACGSSGSVSMVFSAR